MEELFVTCGTGLEPLLAEELKNLGCQNLRISYRGVYVEDQFEKMYLINYCSRLASRVLHPIKKFRCYNAKTLYQAMREIDWHQYISLNKSFAIDANVTHPQLRNSLFAAQVVKDAICDHFREKTGERPTVDVTNPTVQLNLFIRDPEGVLSFDTSGQPLHKRGYRLETVEAPIQETLAAAIATLAQLKEEDIVYDPCCGSGTLLIEAALMATRTAPGYLRKKWGFMHHPQFIQLEWLRTKAEADKARLPLPAGRLFGSDSNRSAIESCKINLKAAGFQQLIAVSQQDFRHCLPKPLPTVILTNPPHGKRLDEVDNLKALYRALGNFMKNQTAKPAKGFVFVGNLELTKEVGLSAKRRYPISNSGIDSRLLEFDLY